MIIRVSFLVVASFAALKISQTKTSSPSKRSAPIISSECEPSKLEHEFEEMENSTANDDHVMQNEEKHVEVEMTQKLVTADFKEFELLVDGEEMNDTTEEKLLKNLVESYKHREVNLKRKLLELNGLKEEQSEIAKLQRLIERDTAKLDSLKMTIVSLKAESKIMREKIREDAVSNKQLDIAKKMLNEMQRKKDVNGIGRSPVKEQLLLLQQQLAELEKCNNNGSARDAKVHEKLEEVKGVELQVLEFKRRNKELELEKREMGVKLATASTKIRTEEEALAKIKEEVTDLCLVHEELLEQVERLQRNRFEMVEELVYQRWLETCLRFEALNHKKLSGKNPRPRPIFNKNSSKELCEKEAHVSLTHDPEIDSNSSNTTLDESDGTETSTTLESSSSSSKSSSSSSSKNYSSSSLVSKLKRLRKTKHELLEISSKGTLSMPRKMSSTKSVHKPMMAQNRLMKRVSFSDSVKSSDYQDVVAVEEEIDDEEIRYGKIMELSRSNVSWDEHELEVEQCDKLRYSNESLVGDPIKDETNVAEDGVKNKISGLGELYSMHELVCRKGDRIKSQLVQVVALFLFFFFSLILLAYFRIK